MDAFTKEGMDTMGASLNYAMNNGVHSDKYEERHDMSEMSGGSLNPTVPLPEGQLLCMLTMNLAENVAVFLM